jgi:hypothetical protein
MWASRRRQPSGREPVAGGSDNLPVRIHVGGRPGHQPARRALDHGGVTVEAALALAVLAVVLVSCLAGIGCLIAQIRCADAAREAARLAGRGDVDLAAAVVVTLAPDGAALSLGGAGDLVTATVTARPIGGLLPGVTITASAAAAREPDR